MTHIVGDIKLYITREGQIVLPAHQKTASVFTSFARTMDPVWADQHCCSQADYPYHGEVAKMVGRAKFHVRRRKGEYHFSIGFDPSTHQEVSIYDLPSHFRTEDGQLLSIESIEKILGSQNVIEVEPRESDGTRMFWILSQYNKGTYYWGLSEIGCNQILV